MCHCNNHYDGQKKMQEGLHGADWWSVLRLQWVQCCVCLLYPSLLIVLREDVTAWHDFLISWLRCHRLPNREKLKLTLHHQKCFREVGGNPNGNREDGKLHTWITPSLDLNQWLPHTHSSTSMTRMKRQLKMSNKWYVLIYINDNVGIPREQRRLVP